MAYEIVFGIVIIVLFAIVYFLVKKISSIKLQLNDIMSQKTSLSVKYGKMSEQFMPFLELYPYDKQNFRFIGTPVDGIQFEDDKIVFVEFKTSESKLSEKQKRIKELVERKQVHWHEVRMS